MRDDHEGGVNDMRQHTDIYDRAERQSVIVGVHFYMNNYRGIIAFKCLKLRVFRV